MNLKKFDNEKQLAYAEVYVPEVPDSDGDFMSAEDIERMAHEFMRKKRMTQVDVNHDNNTDYGCVIVESWIAKPEDPLFIPGAWVVGIHIANEDLWLDIKEGRLNGLSMEVKAKRIAKELELDIPNKVTGVTEKTAGHEHKFTVKFNPETGEFLGGYTNEVDGHSHIISRGTKTNDADGHSHRFVVVDELIYED